MENDLMKTVLEAQKRARQRAFETAVRTNTSLVYSENGKVVKVKPPYRYELVRIEDSEDQSD